MPRNQVKMTDAEIDEIFADEFRITDACEFDLSWTNDTIDQILTARKNWRELGDLYEGKTEIGGYRFITIDGCQAVKGQERKNIIVVDFGDARAIKD